MEKPDLSSRSALLSFIRRHDLAAHKGLGQHWLVSQKVVRLIVSACLPAGGILEIGPGPGTLTQPLSDAAPTVALEVDERARAALAESAPLARFLLADVLKTDLGGILGALERPRVVVSNLPFNIGTAVLERLWDTAEEFDRAVLMFQREVAQRLTAEPGDRRRGALTVLTRLRFDIAEVCKAPPGAFVPQPKVSATVLRFDTRRDGPEVTADLVRLIRSGFRQPRKTLLNNLLAAGPGERAEVEGQLSRSGLDSRRRPHALSEEEWLRLASERRNPTS
ncbi:MAG: ribosomal RNA small subunit methyltransferase A [Armatimonadetes bacterium]|nr:ribosomal RNA small subunit methyltransferase A [Armatimonadota bacterium]